MAKNNANVKKKPANRNKLNLYLDSLLALGFVVELEYRFTGRDIHELLGVGILLALAVHIVLHWQWVVSLTRTFFQKLIHESRLKYAINLVLFFNMLFTLITGLLISRTLGFNLNLTGPGKFPLQKVHQFAAEFNLILVGLHVALAWKWLATNLKKFLSALKFWDNKTTGNSKISSSTEV